MGFSTITSVRGALLEGDVFEAKLDEEDLGEEVLWRRGFEVDKRRVLVSSLSVVEFFTRGRGAGPGRSFSRETDLETDFLSADFPVSLALMFSCKPF
jgi:hypothetical protein